VKSSQQHLKKRFRLSEFLSEKIITGVAFLSIAIILLIFVFVFRETLPIFHQKKGVNMEQQSIEGSQPQVGGEAERASAEMNRPERYGETEPAKPERYGVVTDSTPSERAE
jgi:phosphate transport system permease protein